MSDDRLLDWHEVVEREWLGVSAWAREKASALVTADGQFRKYVEPYEFATVLEQAIAYGRQLERDKQRRG